jgi:hypothetical protein
MIYSIREGFRHLMFFASKDLAKIKLYSLAEVHRKSPGFQLGEDYFSYNSDPLPEDDGSDTVYTTTYSIASVDVME